MGFFRRFFRTGGFLAILHLSSIKNFLLSKINFKPILVPKTDFYLDICEILDKIVKSTKS
jgi:hypothetical protein